MGHITNLTHDILEWCSLRIVQQRWCCKKPLTKACAGSADEFSKQLHSLTHFIECQVHVCMPAAIPETNIHSVMTRH